MSDLQRRYEEERQTQTTREDDTSVDLQKLLIPVYRLRYGTERKTENMPREKEAIIRDCFKHLGDQIEFIIESTRTILDESQTARAYLDTLKNVLLYAREISDRE